MFLAFVCGCDFYLLLGSLQVPWHHSDRFCHCLNFRQCYYSIEGVNLFGKHITNYPCTLPECISNPLSHSQSTALPSVSSLCCLLSALTYLPLRCCSLLGLCASHTQRLSKLLLGSMPQVGHSCYRKLFNLLIWYQYGHWQESTVVWYINRVTSDHKFHCRGSKCMDMN